MSLQNLNVSAPGTLELLQSRRSGSAKAMKGPGPDAAQIRNFVIAASRVPDHGKLAPWRFIVFEGTGRERFGDVLVRALAVAEPTAGPERITQERGRFLRAPVVIGVVSRVREGVPIPEWEQVLSAGASCQTLCIAAHAVGFVANWLTEWYAYSPVVHAALGLAAGERIAGCVYSGHPVEPRGDRPRPEFEAVTSFF
jgi:nitroreductase